MKKYTMNRENVHSIEALEGVYRKTLIYNESVMLFYTRKGRQNSIA